jgi:hypothetical protein
MGKDVRAIVSFGEIPHANCQLHGGTAERFGTLVDPNGHKWLICAGCINSLWEDKQGPVEGARIDEDEPVTLTDDQIRTIVGRMQRMGLIHGE